MIATGCEDKNVRVYYLATSSEQPLKVFSGHLAKVFHVRWSPLREGILCSGSDDGWVSSIFCKTMKLRTESLQHDSSTRKSLMERSARITDKCPRVCNQTKFDSWNRASSTQALHASVHELLLLTYACWKLLLSLRVSLQHRSNLGLHPGRLHQCAERPQSSSERLTVEHRGSLPSHFR